MHRGIIPLFVSTCLAATAIAAAAPAQPPETKSPMVFYVAQGEPGACGPGCQEWIAADGHIDPNAGPRFWELLRKLGIDRKPPVYFNSGGGTVSAALEIGRLMRARGLKAGVGLTVPSKCDRRNPADAACEELKRSGRELPAELDTLNSVCASACVYMLLGGTVRDVRAGARLGVHDPYAPATIRTFDESGRLVDQPYVQSAAALHRGLEALQGALGRYLKDMGVSADLLAAGRGIGPDQVHFLTRAEIVAFGIDRRDSVESTWSLIAKPTGVEAIKIVETRDGSLFRAARLSLTCRDVTTVRLQYLNEIGAGDESPPTALRLSVGERSFPLMRLGSIPQAANGPRRESHGAELPLAALDAAAFVIETAVAPGQSPNGKTESSDRLSVRGAAPALAAFARRCASGMH